MPSNAREKRLAKAEKLEQESKRMEAIAREYRAKALAEKRAVAAFDAAEKRRIVDELRYEIGSWVIESLQAKISFRAAIIKHLSSLPASKGEKLLTAFNELWPEQEKTQELMPETTQQGADSAPL